MASPAAISARGSAASVASEAAEPTCWKWRRRSAPKTGIFRLLPQFLAEFSENTKNGNSLSRA